MYGRYMAQACWGHTERPEWSSAMHNKNEWKTSKLSDWLVHSSPRDNTTSSTTMETEEIPI